ncbi:MAG: YceI family protein [Crocinitomicaceae bacterium]|nr:YceI family protein [Crocinitomicaceae bacterium]
MKYLSIIASAFLLFSCGDSSTNDSTTSNEIEIPAEPEDVIADFQLDTENSSADWDRFLDQKATKKQIKLFGALVDVEMGPLTLNMTGNVIPVGGAMTTTNEECTAASLIFDMSTFKFAEESGEGLFNTKDYPESELTFDSFEVLEGDEDHNYTVTMTLTIQDHSEEIVAPLNIQTSEDSGSISGDISFNTLDFPLRDNAKKSEVNTDEITVHLDLNYLIGGEELAEE